MYSVKGVGITVAGTAPELHRNSLFIAPQRFLRMQTKTRSNISDFLNSKRRHLLVLRFVRTSACGFRTECHKSDR